eukprot:12213375-Karenia_brevis.AAC.1
MLDEHRSIPFKHELSILGNKFTSSNELDSDTTNRIGKMWDAFTNTKSTLCCKGSSLRERLRLLHRTG